jgi:hypothetical protein
LSAICRFPDGFALQHPEILHAPTGAVVAMNSSMKVTELEANHVWKASPGCRILVLDGGAVRFDIPREWVISPRDNHVLIFECRPEASRCTLGVSWHRVPTESFEIPLAMILAHGAATEIRQILERGSIQRVLRPPLEIAWLQFRVLESSDNREMCVRMGIGRAATTQAVFLFEFAPEDELRLFDAWQTLLQTLVLGEYISDPATGVRYEQRG